MWEFCVCLCFVFVCVSILVLQSFEEEEKAVCFAIIVLQMYYYYKCSVIFLAVPWAGLQYVIAVFPDHTHLLFEISLLAQKVKEFKSLSLCMQRCYGPFYNITRKSVDHYYCKKAVSHTFNSHV